MLSPLLARDSLSAEKLLITLSPRLWTVMHGVMHGVMHSVMHSVMRDICLDYLGIMSLCRQARTSSVDRWTYNYYREYLEFYFEQNLDFL